MNTPSRSIASMAAMAVSGHRTRPRSHAVRSGLVTLQALHLDDVTAAEGPFAAVCQGVAQPTSTARQEHCQREQFEVLIGPQHHRRPMQPTGVTIHDHRVRRRNQPETLRSQRQRVTQLRGDEHAADGFAQNPRRGQPVQGVTTDPGGPRLGASERQLRVEWKASPEAGVRNDLVDVHAGTSAPSPPSQRAIPASVENAESAETAATSADSACPRRHFLPTRRLLRQHFLPTRRWVRSQRGGGPGR